MDLIIIFFIKIYFMKIKNKLIFQTETTLENIPELESFNKSINDKISFCDNAINLFEEKQSANIMMKYIFVKELVALFVA